MRTLGIHVTRAAVTWQGTLAPTQAPGRPCRLVVVLIVGDMASWGLPASVRRRCKIAEDPTTRCCFVRCACRGAHAQPPHYASCGLVVRQGFAASDCHCEAARGASVACPIRPWDCPHQARQRMSARCISAVHRAPRAACLSQLLADMLITLRGSALGVRVVQRQFGEATAPEGLRLMTAGSCPRVLDVFGEWCIRGQMLRCTARLRCMPWRRRPARITWCWTPQARRSLQPWLQLAPACMHHCERARLRSDRGQAGRRLTEGCFRHRGVDRDGLALV